MALELAEHNLSEERLEFRDTLRRFFEEHAPIAEARRVMEEEGTGHSPALWSLASEEMGLAGIAISEDAGGQGFGLKELAIALSESGRHLAPIPLFASAGLAARVVQHVAGESAEGWLTPIAEGNAATVAWVEADGDWDPAATTLEVEGGGDDVTLDGEKHFVLAAGAAERIFVVAREPGTHCDEGLGLYVVEHDAPGLVVECRESVDLTRPVWTMRFDGTPAKAVGPRGAAAPGIRAGLDEATALLCAEMEGGMRRVLETAVDYAGDRFQFSRPIGSFQAIKHYMADIAVKIEFARPVLHRAAYALQHGDARLEAKTSHARLACAEAALLAARNAMQAHGAMGYTTASFRMYFS